MTDEQSAPYFGLQERLAKTTDAARPQAVKKRHARGGRTARENLADLTEGAAISEYGQLAVAAQRSRREGDALLSDTAADAVITAVGPVNALLFPPLIAQTAMIINDYTVLAGTQGYFHHRKIDRLLTLAAQDKLPIVMFTEGGGGRPGDTDVLVSMAGLNVPTFYRWAALAGQIPRIAVNHGFCFAGNAALFGAADLRIATETSCIGMAGPTMIEGGGLGSWEPSDIGPVSVHRKNGVVDIVVADEAAATAMTKRVLSCVQGTLSEFQAHEQGALSAMMPSNRRYAFDVRKILHHLFDVGSFIETRPDMGRAIVSGLARLEGRAVAVLASDCRHLGGAIDGESATKAAALYELAERWKLPVVSFIDTPGFMVGPDSEADGAPRLMSELFIAGATLTQPIIAIFLRRAYGLGAMAMTGGSFEVPRYAVSWPQGEFGAMGLEGAVQLGFRQELADASDDTARQALFDALLSEMYAKGRATEAASYLEIDAVIQPEDTRAAIAAALVSC
ncbi:MAG: carboxyl transferase domain-containing protein [Luminiphilus sp.]|nr:carboxyl transferase domain-containing protein [Luminiphilus sp.]